MPKKSKKDIYDLSENDLKIMHNRVSQKSFSGVYCPRRNDNKFCAVCRDVAALWNKHNETGLETSEYSKKAKTYKAGASVFMNVIFPDNPSEVRILQCGIKMLQGITNGIFYQDWGPVYHPEKGMTIKVLKSVDSGFNTYTPSPDISKGKRALEDSSVLDNLFDLSTIDALRETVEIFNISSIEKSIAFDILPGWDTSDPHNFWQTRYYHYNISEEAIKDGIPSTPHIQETEESDEDIPFNQPPKQKMEDDVQFEGEEYETKKPEEKTKKYTLENPPGCFGQYFDKTDDDCNDASCDDIRTACAKRTAKG